MIIFLQNAKYCIMSDLMALYSTKISSPIGQITLASDGKNLVGLWNEGQKYHGDEIFDGFIENNQLPIFNQAKKWLDRYFKGEKPNLHDVRIAPIGGEFRQIVWNILCSIPYGHVVSYGDIAKIVAKKLGKKSMSCQAIGGAVGHNPISIIIPCHRVVGADGSLTGYAGGIELKAKLLALEGARLKKKLA